MKRLMDMTEPELKRYMQLLAEATGSIMPLDRDGKTPCLFCVLVFDDMEGGVTQYVSNADRPGMIKALRETADRLEKREDLPR